MQLVTFKQAKRLKALGFDWNTKTFYHPDGTADIYCCCNHNKTGMVSAPTVALALKWLRDKKQAFTTILFKRDLDHRPYYVVAFAGRLFSGQRGELTVEDFKQSCPHTYEEAEKFLLDEMLTTLKKKWTKYCQ